jgi:high affinity Mn2+ porin
MFSKAIANILPISFGNIFLGILVNLLCSSTNAQVATITQNTNNPVTITNQQENWNYHLQSTWIEQANSAFTSPYSGTNSFQNKRATEHTFSFSVFLGYKLPETTELYYNPEIFQGYGLSHTLGIAGFPNGEAVKSSFANLHYNTSRLFLRHTWGLGGEKEKVEDDTRSAGC